jgi:hypothetical protein
MAGLEALHQARDSVREVEERRARREENRQRIEAEAAEAGDRLRELEKLYAENDSGSQEQTRLLEEKENGAYTFGIQDGYQMDTECIHDVSKLDTQVRLGKVSIGEDSLGEEREGENCADKPRRARFTPPTLEEVRAYCLERNNGVDAQHFLDYYSANGWKVGRNPMKDWKAAVRTWERNGVNRKAGSAAELEDSYRMMRDWANG